VSVLTYPVVAIPDLHGQLRWLDALVAQLRSHPVWPTATLVFLGDLVDRGPDVQGTVQRVMELLSEKPGSVCLMGNHDLALVKAAGLNEPPEQFWVEKYRTNYDSDRTFLSYLGRAAERHTSEKWVSDLAALREAMPDAHRAFLSGLPWVAEAAGHVFVHNGLSRELNEPAEIQLHALRQKRWADVVSPKLGTKTHDHWQTHYPVWLGADRRLNADPLVVPNKVQVVGHVRVDEPDVNPVRIRLDTTGGVHPPLTAAVFRGAGEPVEFVAG
jgi:serine/threonine protein phosphatase 1